MPAGAPKGNTNAEKWSREKAHDLFDKALELAKRKTFYEVPGRKKPVEAFEFDFIGELVGELDVYHQLFTFDLPRRFEELQPTVKQLLKRMELNCYYNTKRGIINTAVGIVNLKSNHKWTDRQDMTSGGEKIQITREIIKGK